MSGKVGYGINKFSHRKTEEISLKRGKLLARDWKCRISFKIS